MAKKLNKKVAFIGLLFLLVIVAAGVGLTIRHLYNRDPDLNLKLAREALAANNYERAERLLSRASRFGKNDAYRIERLFELADLHLINNEYHQATWEKALRCWNTIVNINPGHIEAHRRILRYFYDVADSGGASVWKTVYDNASELIEQLEKAGQEVDPETLKMYGRAALAIAQRGGTADRSKYLEEAMHTFRTLIERRPGEPDYYAYLADALFLQGNLNAQMGVMNATETAHQEAVKWLDEAIEKADNKAEAIAKRYAFEIRTLGNDPNRIETLRAELQEHIQSVEPNAELLTVLSQAYEIPGKTAAEAELNQAIEMARQAFRLAPDQFEYGYRLAVLLYRKGSAFNDVRAMEDALQLAEEMKSMEQTQPVPGPFEARNLAYRNALNIFLARCYLEKAIAKPDEAQPWIQKAEPIVEQIAQYYVSNEHAAVQQWEGILALAKGQRERAIRLLYQAYEQSRALDSTNQPSSIDPVLCTVLARIAKEENLIGLEREFLEKALTNRARIILDKPSLILDYADVMTRLQAWNQAASYAQMYQQRYGLTERSQKIIIDAALALGQEEPIKQALAALPDGSVEHMLLELRFVTSRITQLSRQLAQHQQEQPDQQIQIPEEVRTDLENLRSRQKELLLDLIEAAPDEIEVAQVQSVCSYYLQNGMKDHAVSLLDAYLAQRPDTLAIRLLRLQAEEPDPLSIPRERYHALQEEAISKLSDPRQRALAMADLFRSRGDYEQAMAVLNKAAETIQDDKNQFVAEQFEIALESENIEKAEALLQTIRSQNLDGCEGNLAAARLELVKKNYALALRRVDECLTIKPLLSMGYYLKSRIYEQMGDLESAIENSQRAMQMDTLNRLYAKNHASLLFNRNTALGSQLTSEQQNELIQAITMAMYLNPNDWQLQSVYAEVISSYSPDRALALRQQILQQYPNVTNAIMLGNMALRLAEREDNLVKKSGLVELAGNAFTQALKLDPNNENAKSAYADYLSRTQQGEKAEALLRDDTHLLWRFYLQNGQFEKAQEVLLQLHQDDPDNAVVLRGLVRVAEGLGDRHRLKQYLDLLAAKDNDKNEQLWLIQKYLDGGYVEEGSKLLASVKERYPEEKLTLLMDAWLMMTNGQLREALNLTNRYLEIDSNNAGAWRLRGRIYRLLNEPHHAVDDLQRSKSLSANPAVSIELATVFSEMGQMDAAIGELVNASQQPQAPMQIRLLLELFYQRSNRLSDLERFYTRMLERYPDSPFWSIRAGQFYLSKKDTAQAVKYFRQAWEIHRQQDTNDPITFNLYLEALNQNKQYAEAINTATPWTDGPLAPVAYAQMAQAHFYQGQNERAESLFFLALDKGGESDWFQDTVLSMMLNTVGLNSAIQWTQKNPDALPSRLLSYRIALINEQFNRGMELIDRCLADISPNSPNWGNLALKKANLLVQAYMKTADTQYRNQAIAMFEQILEQYPDNPSLLNNLAYLLASNDQQLEQAINYARRAHQRDPGNPIYLDTYAFAQYKNGNFEQARQNLLRALQLYDAQRAQVPWDVYNHLGMVYESLGQIAEAIDSYHKALQVAADIPEKERKAIEERVSTLQQQANTSL